LKSECPELLAERMSKLYSRTALFVTVGYMILIGALLISNLHNSDHEGQTVGFLIIGLPWSAVIRTLPGKKYLVYSLALALNVATLYVFVLSIARVFGRDSN
jgi:hypothetical protein